MKKKVLIFMIILLLGVSFVYSDESQIIDDSTYDEFINLLLESPNIDYNRISLYNIPMAKQKIFDSLNLDFLILGPKVEKVEYGAFIGCKIQYLIAFNPDIDFDQNAYIFFNIGTESSLGFKPDRAPKQIFVNPPLKLIEKIINSK